MADEMKAEDRLKIYTAMTETSRKWVTAMDAKAGFLSALNAAMLAFMWSGAKFSEGGTWPRGFALLASVFAIFSLFSALWAVIPRGSLRAIFGKTSRYTNNFKAISFYGFVAENYPKGSEAKFIADVMAMDAQELCRETLEQHYTISHGLQIKQIWVKRASSFLLIALILASAALGAKFSFDTATAKATDVPVCVCNTGSKTLP